MPSTQLGNVLGRLRMSLAVQQARDLTDHELVSRFATTGDEAAFGALMQRHVAMVLGVCRRILPGLHDAEDACQATFLVLARKAASVRKREGLAAWLYQVARHVALKVRNEAVRRSAREKASQIRALASTGNVWHETLLALDEEMSRLPSTYRAALVLCYLEGKTQDEAARELGWSLGALRGRLERARDKLRERLTRRGVTMPAALLGIALGNSQTSAGVAGSLVVKTVAAAKLFAAGRTVPMRAALLAEKTVRGLFAAKIKVTASALVVALSLLTAGLGFAVSGWQSDKDSTLGCGNLARKIRA